MRIAEQLRQKRVWGTILFVGFFLFVAYWPFPRLELVDVKTGRSFYYPFPKNHCFEVIYRAEGSQRSEIRRFRIEGNGKLQLLETIYSLTSPGLREFLDPNRIVRQGNALVVKGDAAAFPELHLVVEQPGERVLALGKRQKIDLSELFAVETLVILKVADKPLLFFIWKRVLNQH